MLVPRLKTSVRQAASNEFTAAEIEAQAPDFGGHEDLFVYLKAARAYYLDGDPGAALRLLGPEQPGPLSPPYLAFSRETLRGQALMATGDWQVAAAQWQGLLPRASQPWQKEAVELGLALTWERTGALNKVFLPETRLSSPRIAEILLRQSAGPILLRMAIADPQTPEQRPLARFVLLFKEATRGLYAGFLRDYSPDELVKDGADEKQVPHGTNPSKFLWKGQSEFYPCPDLKSVVTELAANPRSSHGLLCLGEFVRTNDLDFFETKRPGPDELGGAKPIFPGERYSRGEVYKSLIAAPSTPDNDRAYALFRAINCYAPNGGNGCGGKDVVLAQRKAWFQTLKTNYGATSWAKSLKIYW